MAIYEEISSNVRKSYLLLFLFFVIIALLGYALGALYGNPYIGLTLAFIISFFYTLFSYFAGDSVILTMNGAKEASKQQFPHLVNTVEGLAIAAGIPTPKIYVIDDTAINAFATGRDPKHASVTVTTGCLQRLKRDELEGVLGHEMSHIKNYDVRYMMLVVMLVGITLLLSDIFLRSMWYGGGRRDNRRNSGAILIILGLALAIISPIIVRLVQLAISRRREFLADASGALLTRYPPGLASALKKIRDDKEPLVEAADRSSAHLYIENPLAKVRERRVNLWSTHPDINERIHRLEKM